MLDTIWYRGPDQRGIAEYGGKRGSVTLGMNRLSIIDTEEHSIPYEDESRRYALVYNGELYNHQELRSALIESYSFQSGSDAETVLHDFIQNGTKGFEAYNGMYAFALYDSKEKKTYLVRDKAGEKPLYFVKGDGFIAFASEMKSLHKLVNAKESSTLAYRAFEFCVGRNTMFEGISQVLPGEYLEITDDGNISFHDYWKIWDHPIDLPDNLEVLENRLTELLEDSILLRTRNCAHKYAVFTAGGVDSALMACIAKPERLYYCHYDLGKAFDELDYAKLVAKKIDRELIVVRPSKEDFERTQEKIAFHLDTPCTWTSFSLWMLLESLHDDIKVTMTGEGADEAFGGYHRYHLLHHDEQIHQLEAMKEYQYMIQRYYGSPTERYVRLINRCDKAQDQEVLTYLHEQVETYFSKIGGQVMHGMGLNDLYTTMQVLLQMSDRINMGFSVENRSPFLDYRLLQFAFSLPPGYKIRDGVTKWLLKRVSKKFIPHEIANRVDKRGFSAPVNIWFGWDKLGQYDRSAYRNRVHKTWKRTFYPQITEFPGGS
jgi:asparagine synthase (glutamine-hydrolysing)